MTHSTFFDVYVNMADVLDLSDIDCEAAGIHESILDIEFAVEFELIVSDFGRPAVMHLANGDPGYPAEGPEYEVAIASNLKKVLAEVVSDRIATLVITPLRNWIDSNIETIADDAFEDL